MGARLESAHFDVLEELIRAQYARGGDRGRALELANTHLQIARHVARLWARMARELNLLSEESAVYLARLQVDPGGRMAKGIGRGGRRRGDDSGFLVQR